MNTFRKGGLGVKFETLLIEYDANGVKQPVNLSPASTKDFYFTKPDGTTVGPEAGSFITNGADGWLRFINSTGHVELDQAGYWRIQVQCVFSAGFSGKTLKQNSEFFVEP